MPRYKWKSGWLRRVRASDALPLLPIEGLSATPPPPKPVRRRRSGVSGPYAEESALLAIRAGCSRDLGDLKQLAEGKIRRVGQRLLCTHAEHLALSLGYTVTREAPGGPCGCEGLVPNELFVQRARPLMFALRVLHELAHALLRDTTYTHGDVWVLTIFLAIPAAALPHLELVVGVPQWTIRERRRLEAAISRG